MHLFSVNNKKQQNTISAVMIFVLSLIRYSETYNFLVFYSTPIKSMNILGDGIVRHLLNAGHKVTYVTAFPVDWGSNQNIRQIGVSKNTAFIENDDKRKISYILENSTPNYNRLYYQKFGLVLGNLTFSNENVTSFLENTNESFEAVIVDYFENEVFAGLAAVFDCPLIWTFSVATNWFPLRLIDEPSNPAYTVDYFSTNVAPLDFFQRVTELWTQIRWYYYKWFVTMPQEKEFYENIFGPLIRKRGRTPPLYEDLIFNASLLFCNDFNIAGKIPKTPQNFKLVGGQHIEIPTKPLSNDLQKIMDNSEHGVIYFSLGSIWKAKFIPASILRRLLQVFGQLKHTVIWKFEEDMQNVPKNVHIVKWAPQQSILAHPKLEIFITHSGQLSSIEAIHFGVPIIGVPVSFDQVNNIKRAVESGYAIEVKLNYDLPKSLKEALTTMLSDSTYKQKVKSVSALYHDRLVPPGEEIVFWVEHVVRTRGATYLRPPSLHVPLYQKLYLDLVVLILIALTIILIGLIFLLKQTRINSVSISKKNI